jgi:hypothetical protein
MSRPISEKEIERKLKSWARSSGFYVRKFSSPNNRSVPDDIFVKDGLTVYLELKREFEEPKEAQWAEIDELRLHGAIAEYADGVEIGKLILLGKVAPAQPGDRSHPRTRVLG